MSYYIQQQNLGNQPDMSVYLSSLKSRGESCDESESRYFFLEDCLALLDINPFPVDGLLVSHCVNSRPVLLKLSKTQTIC